jgi:transmembrane sensor
MKPFIDSLLEKHSLGLCTPEEMAILEKWYADFPEKGVPWRDEAEKQSMKEMMKAEIFAEIRPRNYKLWWAAAAAAVMIGVAVFIYQRPEDKIITAAAGKGILKMELPDHSMMWMEPGTTLRYSKDGRSIELIDGMACFSVQQQAAHPFVVRMPGRITAKVLGTAFTVKKYKQSEEVQVMVNSGAVQVSDSTHVLGVLQANQQLTYANLTVTRTEGTINDWTSGDLTLSNTPLKEVIRILETHYGVQVTVNTPDITAYRFTLRISEQVTVAEVLDMLKDISGLEFTRNGNRVIIH